MFKYSGVTLPRNSGLAAGGMTTVITFDDVINVGEVISCVGETAAGTTWNVPVI